MSPIDLNVYRVKKLAGSKDRHSKVFTSKGPRDRRMRLSIATAIKLYDLQDRLRHDRPSKTVEWLLQKAQAAIHDLSEFSDVNVFQSTSLSSPTNPKSCPNKGTDFHVKSFASCKGNRESSSSRYSRSAAAVSRPKRRENAILNPIVRKENRTKARERARERTRLKCSPKQNLKLLPQQPLSENLLPQCPLDSSPSLSYTNSQKTFQFSSSQDGVSSGQSNVGTSSEHSTGLQGTGFQQDFPCTTGFSIEDQVNCSEFSSEGQFFSNRELLQDLQELDSADICLRSFVEPPQTCGIILSNTSIISSSPSSPYPPSYTLLDNVIYVPGCTVVFDSQ